LTRECLPNYTGWSIKFFKILASLGFHNILAPRMSSLWISKKGTHLWEVNVWNLLPMKKTWIVNHTWTLTINYHSPFRVSKYWIWIFISQYACILCLYNVFKTLKHNILKVGHLRSKKSNKELSYLWKYLDHIPFAKFQNGEIHFILRLIFFKTNV
jgi:hypothetical protein